MAFGGIKDRSTGWRREQPRLISRSPLRQFRRRLDVRQGGRLKINIGRPDIDERAASIIEKNARLRACCNGA
jgi:hypothetical protein